MIVPSPERSGPLTMRPARSFIGETPVSITATPTPSPRLPVPQADVAPAAFTNDDATDASSYTLLAKRTDELSVTAYTAAFARTVASAAAGTCALKPLTTGRS